MTDADSVRGWGRDATRSSESRLSKLQVIEPLWHDDSSVPEYIHRELIFHRELKKKAPANPHAGETTPIALNSSLLFIG